MTPLSFDIETCKDVLGDELVREVSDDARRAAESGGPAKSYGGGATYWDQAVNSMKSVVWVDAFVKRKARLERTKQ